MNPIGIILVSAILFGLTIFSWIKILVSPPDPQGKRNQAEFQFLSASALTTVAIVWTIIAAISLKDA
ncbi:hypothetical protein [Porphyrobacter sp. YT40]|uniref:hypothetical protein n=1 Tax=Porphyrobacter sp. YT40 TaxID=2547601 RepID=UPI0011435D66|nr:hypothetical protein [Porphyrobacter sp. YT40]QDH35216.1 hypothetical protein E2E27_13345 [Porphyrobacter sp. YT40]